jgi:ribosomal protein S14
MTKNTHTCKYCSNKDAILRPNPYMAELYNDYKKFYICDHCYHELCMDI